MLLEGATIPFIARYRKEVTGGLEDYLITQLRDRHQQLVDLHKRREAILKSIEEQQKLTPELKSKILAASTLSELEDLYLPYRPKRNTRGTVAIEKGLEPLTQYIYAQQGNDLESKVSEYVDADKGVPTSEEALAGARDIMAEWINKSKEVRTKIRALFMEQGIVYSGVLKGKEAEAQKYRDYFDWKEPIKSIPSHRLLALRRAEKEGFLSMDIYPNEEDAHYLIERITVKASGPLSEQVQLAGKDAYKRLLKPSIETDVRLQTKIKADDMAIKVFADNVRQLLMAAPLGQKSVLAIDPGIRTGCKVVCLGALGHIVHHHVIFPEQASRRAEAESSLQHMISTYAIEAIAIGNGTAGRETEQFVKGIHFGRPIPVIMVSESGASVYSASEVAREEFPHYDVTVRGAISIGRRLIDPLAELVKIDPKSVGVGQYQHDVDQHKLQQALDDVVIQSVNQVGVEVNTASKQLLSYVSGLGPLLAQNIVEYREKNGKFRSRQELKKVPRMRDKAFEQCAGFLRIRDSMHPLDTSAVHPESYEVVEQMAHDQQCTITELIKDAQRRKSISLQRYVTDKVGLPTLQDILSELEKPGRDPREKFEEFKFSEEVHAIQDVRVGMKLPGIVTNVTNFGAFVDIGVHQDGLVHVSHISDRFAKDPAEVLKVQQKVMVTVTEVDVSRKRIGLSLKTDPFGATRPPAEPKSASEPEPSYHDKLSMLKSKFK